MRKNGEFKGSQAAGAFGQPPELQQGEQAFNPFLNESRFGSSYEYVKTLVLLPVLLLRVIFAAVWILYYQDRVAWSEECIDEAVSQLATSVVVACQAFCADEFVFLRVSVDSRHGETSSTPGSSDSCQ
jgi:hypothetical protein